MEMAAMKRDRKASIFYKYFVDMLQAFEEMRDVLKPGGNLVMIIGKEQRVKMDKIEGVIELGRVMEEMGKSVGLAHLYSVDVLLQKASMRGAIPTEHIIFFKKP